jgi:hypothetical protein
LWFVPDEDGLSPRVSLHIIGAIMNIASLSRLALAMVVFAMGFVTSFAQQRPGPEGFQAKVLDNNAGAQYVMLGWFGVQGNDVPDSYNVYQASKETEDITKFTKIGSVVVDPAKPPRENYYTYNVENLAAGTYTFFVRAVWGNEESARTMIKVVTIKDKNEKKVVFVSVPVKNGSEGKRYTYPVRAETNAGTKIRYGIVNGPEGMTIDQETGLIVWENPRAGRYEIKIKAWVEVGGQIVMVYQYYVLEISGDKPKTETCATFKGAVTIEGANATANGVVTAWRMERIVRTPNGDTTTTFRPVYTAKIVAGRYELKVPAGTYKLRVEGETFLAEWYDNVVELADAKTVSIACDQFETIDFVVTKRAEPVKVVIAGRVFDAETEAGLKALVVFEVRSRDPLAANALMRRVVAETNAEGYYEVKIQAGIPYIGTATVIGRDKQSEYLVEFWNNTNDASQASTITLTANEDGFRFPMDKRPVYQNGFTGTMKNFYTSAGVTGKVVAHQLVSRAKENGDSVIVKNKAITVETDANGNYSFTNLTPGVYIVFGMPGTRPYIPGWMRMGEKAAGSWLNATRVEVGDVMVAVQYDILLDTAKGERGKGRVRGWVYDKRGGIVHKVGEETPQGDAAVVGTLVLARDEQGDVVDFAMSVNEGAYELTELSYGTVTLEADRVDYTPSVQTITVDDQNLDQEVSIGLVMSTTSVDVPVDAVGTRVNLFPNPTAASASLRFVATQGTATIRVVSMTGVTLATQTVDVVAGETTMQLATSQLPAGMVMVHVTNGTTSFALPLQIVR